jgi:hypothetical protein
MIEPINDGNMGDALDLLARGFPTRSTESWRSGLEKHRASRMRDPAWPQGFLFRRRDQWAGIILTLATRRARGPGSTEPIVNLSGWYIDPDARWSAISMLKGLIDRRPAIFTDLSPAPAVVKLSHGVGFQDWSDGFLLISSAHALLAPRQRSRVVQLKALPKEALDDADRGLLGDHERLGCIAAVLDTGAAWRPLIFARRRWKDRLPLAHLIYAESRIEAINHRRSIAWFLMKMGFPILRIETKLGDTPRGCIARPSVKLCRGNMPPDRIDYAYSEFVFLDIA